MSLRYLLGPITPEFVRENLHEERQTGRCLAFDPAGTSDLAIAPDDTWQSICARLPSGWQPDAIVLYLSYRTVPECLWSAPVPLLGLAADWNLLWHYYRRRLPACDLVLADLPGVEVLAREGILHARAANLFGCERLHLDDPALAGPRDLDVVFLGNLHPAIQRERLAWLGRLARLGRRWRLALGTGVFGAAYRAMLGRARIVFNRSIRGECNQRAFEAAAAGALLFQEAGNPEVPLYFTEGREYVAYTEDDLEHYLTREEERQRIATASGSTASQPCGTRSWPAWRPTGPPSRSEHASASSARGRRACSTAAGRPWARSTWTPP